jgi:UDP-2-acetamido-2-deoxy-ribo-hexuluronate aminotransferase
MAVNLFGQMADYQALNAIAEKYGIPVIEDAAQSFGAIQSGVKSCAATLIGSTSFFPAKPLGCYGDGGALFTNDQILAAKMRAIRTHGGEQRHHHPYLGMNGRLDTLQAAILLAKFPYFTGEIRARQRIGARYSELLRACCVVPQIEKENTHVYALYTIRVGNREQLQNALRADGIPSVVYYPRCLHEQPVFSSLGYGKGSFPVAEQAAKEVLSLPMHPWLTEEQQEGIANIVRKYA